ncbi:AraC family transcriptional regulator [Neobacillus mesonae]|nr:AraC family transcriptional regulator [Neobacillus mesonae]
MRNTLNAPVDARIPADFELPFRMLYHETKPYQHELPDHMHDWHELICVHQGKGKIFIDHMSLDMEPGNLIIIPGNTIHRIFPDPDNLLTSSAFYISPGLFHGMGSEAASTLQLFERHRQTKIYKRQFSSQELNDVCEMIDHIHSEINSRKPMRTYSTLLHLQLLLIYLTRLSSVTEQTPASMSGPDWLTRSLSKIEDELHSRVSLSLLAKDASVSPAHFSRVFKQYTGMTPTDYVTARRIILSKDKLIHSDDTMAVIAEACGFDSLPHFYRMFKKHTGMTPSSYRKSMRM